MRHSIYAEKASPLSNLKQADGATGLTPEGLAMYPRVHLWFTLFFAQPCISEYLNLRDKSLEPHTLVVTGEHEPSQ